MRTLRKVDPEQVWYDFDDCVDFSQYEDKVIIAGNRHFKEYGDSTLVDVVMGNYYDEDSQLVVDDDCVCYEDEIGYDYDKYAELKKLTGKDWTCYEFKGYSQGDWQEVYYVENEVTENELRYMEAFYMGKMSEFVHDEDTYYYVEDDIVWKGKAAICKELGFNEADTEVYDESGELIK